MHNAETYSELTPEQAQALFLALGATCYGNNQWRGMFASDTGLTYGGVTKWLQEGKKPPLWPILLLQERIERHRLTLILQNLSTALQDAAEV